MAEGSFAGVRRPLAVGLHFGAGSTADAKMRVPEADIAGGGAGHVNFELCILSVRMLKKRDSLRRDQLTS